MADLPNAAVKRLLVDGSNGCRVSGSALELAAAKVAGIIRQLGQAAGEKAANDKRKTIKDEDVAAALSDMMASAAPEPPAADAGMGSSF